jgi:hypothetical protein
MNRGEGLNKPDTEWFNAVTMAVSTFGIRFGADETMYVDRPNPDGTQWNIVLPRSLASSDGGLTGKHHFKIEPQGTTAIQVLGGSRVRDVAGAMNRVPLTGDAGFAATVDLFKTVAIAASVYVWVEFDDALVPAALTVNTGAAYPDPDNASEKLVLGYVTFVGGEITEIEQYWTGGDWRDQFEKYDGDSLSYNANNETEMLDFDTAASGTAETINNYTEDMIPFKNSADLQLAWTNMEFFSSALVGYWDSIPAYPFAWSDLSDTSGDPTNPAADGYVPFVTGNLLTLVDGGPGGSGPWWKLGNIIPADAYGQVIGNPTQQIVIDLLNQRLTVAGGASWTLDWAARELDGADWTVLLNTIFKSADTTVAASGDGSIENQGGYYGAAGIYVDKGGAVAAARFRTGTQVADFCDTVSAGYLAWGNNQVTLAPAASAAQFQDVARVLVACDGTYAANATGSINVDAASAYYHGADQGQTAIDGGNELFGGGIFKNEASWTFFTIQTVVPGSGVKQLRILALDVT